MSFQHQAYVDYALGKEGTISRLNPIYKLPMIAEGSDVTAGKFAFVGTDAEKQVKGILAGATSVAGFVVFEKMTVALSASNSLVVPEGEEVALILKGYVYCKPTTAAAKGQNVIVNPTTGEIQTAALIFTNSVTASNDAVSLAVADNAATGSVEVTGTMSVTSDIPEGFIDTGWVVVTGSLANQVCEIAKI